MSPNGELMEIDQYKPAIFYLMAVDNWIKFGITSNQERRWKQYLKDLGDYAREPFKTEDYEYRWQALLIEQVLKWRLWKYVSHKKHEWVEDLPTELIVFLYQETRDQLKDEFDRHEHIHKRDTATATAYYQDIARHEFKNEHGT